MKKINKLDILVLEDEPILLDTICEVISRSGLNCGAYSSGIEAISYLNSLQIEELPTGYLIDMKICENISPQNLAQELASSENLYNLLKSKNINLDLFRFMSGHRSGHDLGVLQRTQIPFVKKDVKFMNYLNSQYLPIFKN